MAPSATDPIPRTSLTMRAIAAAQRWSSVDLGRDFADYQRRLTLRYGEFITLTFIVGLIVGWPTDRWFFGNDAHVLAALQRWRVWTLIFNLAVLGTAQALRRRPRWVFPVVTSMALLQAAVVADLHARAGGLDAMWFHYSYLVPLVMLPLPLPLSYRTIATVGVALSYVASFFTAVPSHAEHPLLATSLTTLGFVTVASVAFGHQLSRLVRANYQQRVELAQRADDLEERVAQRTQRLHELSLHLLTTREHERRRVARELHDELAQILTALRLELRIARRSQSSHDPMLRRLDELVGCAFEAKERIIAALQPASIDELGLTGAIRESASRLTADGALHIDVVETTPVGEVDSDVATAAYRVVQEALSNAVRHGQASHIKVTLSLSDTNLIVHTIDNGTGFDVAATDHGFGLLGMRQRAQALGGHLEATSTPKRTTITLTLPTHPESTPLQTLDTTI